MLSAHHRGRNYATPFTSWVHRTINVIFKWRCFLYVNNVSYYPIFLPYTYLTLSEEFQFLLLFLHLYSLCIKWICMADSLFKELLIRSVLFVQTQSLPASLDSSVFHSSLLLTQLSQFYLPRGILPTLLYLIPPLQSQPWSFLIQMSVLTSPASAGHCLLIPPQGPCWSMSQTLLLLHSPVGSACC